MNGYFTDSKSEHDKLINETESFIQEYRKRFLKNYDFKSASVTSCLRKYLKTDSYIEPKECAQNDAYEKFEDKIFQKVTN